MTYPRFYLNFRHEAKPPAEVAPSVSAFADRHRHDAFCRAHLRDRLDLPAAKVADEELIGELERGGGSSIL